MAVHIKSRIEEAAILALLGAAVAVTVVSIFAVGATGYLPSTALDMASKLHAMVLWMAAAIGLVVGGLYGLSQERDTHLRGARYYADPREASQVLQRMQHERVRGRQKRNHIRGINIAGVELAMRTEVEHLYIEGLTGGGKTVLLESIIDQILARGDRLVLFDPKGELASRYFDPDTCEMLGPWDVRAAVWNAYADLGKVALVDEFASSVLGVHEATGEAKEWRQAAAALLGGIIRSYMVGGRAWTWADIGDALTNGPVAVIQRAAEGDPLIRHDFASVFPAPGDPDHKPHIDRRGGSVTGVMAATIRWLATYARVDEKDSFRKRFSPKRWLLREAHAEKQIIFLNHSSLYAGAAEQLFGAILASMAAVVASPEMPEQPAEAPHTWFILDEFPQAGTTAFKAIQKLAEMGRSRGCAVVLAIQHEKQITEKLGEAGAAAVLEQQVTRIYTKTASGTAEAISRRIGQRDIDRIETTAQNGAVLGKSKRTMTEQVILPGELMELTAKIKGSGRGAQLIMHSGAVLGKLTQQFPDECPPQADAFVPSETWAHGTLPDTPAADPVEGAEVGGDTDGAAADTNIHFD
jgi:type IV secretory pathway TraG/TraD family ATPase VirD4